MVNTERSVISVAWVWGWVREIVEKWKMDWEPDVNGSQDRIIFTRVLQTAAEKENESENQWGKNHEDGRKPHLFLWAFFFFFFTARCNVSDNNIFKTLFLLFLNHGSVADILNLTKLDKASMEKMRNVTPGIPVNVLVIACDLWISSELD